MARTHEETIHAVREWKDFISNVENIPLNPNHTYKDENNVYERLTEYVKDWTESVFGVYTNKNDELVNLPAEEEGPECKDWYEAIGGKMTPLAGDWYQVALKGAKNGAVLSLPQLDQGNWTDPSSTMNARDEINNAVYSTFFPAYRALRDNFSKRSIFQWIFNHKQYTAERDALKVMTSLITSMTGCSKIELDAKYMQHKQEFTAEEIANVAVEYSNREVNMHEPEEVALFKDEERFDRHINLKNKRMEMDSDELFEGEGRLDNYFYTDEEIEEMNNRPDPVDGPIVDYLPAEEKLEKFNEKEQIDEMCAKFTRAIKTTEETEDSIFRAMRIHVYGPLHNAAQRLCSIHDAMKFTYKEVEVEVLPGEEDDKEVNGEDEKALQGKEDDKKVNGEDEKALQGKEEDKKVNGEDEKALQGKEDDKKVNGEDEKALQGEEPENKVKEEVVEVLQGEEYKNEFSKIAPRSVRGMFETAFKALGAEDTREIVKTVNGKEVREKVGGSLFGITTLKDRIVAAQRIANMMLKYRTPVGFYPELSENYAKSYHILEHTEQVTEFLKENYADKYGESEINTAVKLARHVAAVKNRGEQPITYNVFEIGYRPDPWKITEEQKLLGNAQKMVMKGLIKDETLKTIINENVNRWKQARDMQNPKTKKMMDRNAIEKQWRESDKKLAEAYKGYDAAATENVVNSALAQYNEQKKEQEKLQVNLKEPKTQTSPPVKKPVQTQPPVNKK